MATTDPSTVLGPNGAIARRLAAYESRAEQLRMAGAVSDAIENGRHLLVEAGTGVGKSFAYLVPAILAVADAGKKVVVSTHTISLQEQLLSKDIPFLRSVMPQEFTAVLVKGRSNYISIRRSDVAAQRAMTTFSKDEEFDQLNEIRFWMGHTSDGSRSDLKFRPLPTVWDAVASEDGNCLGRKCSKYNDCFYFKARRRMRSANILVVNHALFMSDLALRAAGTGLLPKYDVAVFDEAHTLEAVAAEHLGLRITSGQLDYNLNRLCSDRTEKGLLRFHQMHAAINQVQRTRTAAQAFFAALAEWRGRPASGNGRVRQPLGLSSDLTEQLKILASAIQLGTESIEDEAQRVELNSARDRCDTLAATIDAWQQQQIEEAVYWVDSTPTSYGRPKVSLACSPLDVGPMLRRELFEKVSTCILTSATLAVGTPPRFDFVKNRLGLTRCETLQLGSPFDYASQVTLHLPRNLPDPSDEAMAYERSAIAAIPHYLDLTGGKAFVLFTSYKMMETAVRQLAPWFASRNIALLAQSDGMPRSQMVEAFKKDVSSVLFGVDSFWQGVDVPGEALSNVIIVRLPFSVPSHPLLEARLEGIRKRGGNPFVEYQIPEAVIKLKQGFGRLIRTRTDRGIVVILDPRLHTKPYGRTFLNSLPGCPKIIDDLKAGLPRPGEPAG